MVYIPPSTQSGAQRKQAANRQGSPQTVNRDLEGGDPGPNYGEYQPGIENAIPIYGSIAAGTTGPSEGDNRGAGERWADPMGIIWGQHKRVGVQPDSYRLGEDMGVLGTSMAGAYANTGDRLSGDAIRYGNTGMTYGNQAAQFGQLGAVQGDYYGQQAQAQGQALSHLGSQARMEASGLGQGTISRGTQLGVEQRNLGQNVSNLGGSFLDRSSPNLNFKPQNNALRSAQGSADQLSALEATEGPSAAQAQLQQATDRSMAQNLALARSGRGFGQDASAMSDALAQNAAAGSTAAQQSAQLRAQENAAWRARQAANLGAAAGIQQGVGQQFGTQQQYLGDLQQRQQQLNADQALQAYGLGASIWGQGAQTELGARAQGTDAIMGGHNVGLQGATQGAQVYDAGTGRMLQGSGMGMQGSLGGMQGAQLGVDATQTAAGIQYGGLGGILDVARTEQAGQQAYVRGSQMDQQNQAQADKDRNNFWEFMGGVASIF